MSDDEDVVENEPGDSDKEMADAWAAALEEDADGNGEASSEAKEAYDDLIGNDDDFLTPNLEEFTDDVGRRMADDNPDLGVILDIPVRISMVVGTSQISIRNLLQLNQGSVVELDRLAGEPLDVLVNNTLVAHGEVVVVNDKFGIRLTDVVSAAERIRNLN
jgi:flagellar motor switch protein FliN/FliY